MDEQQQPGWNALEASKSILEWTTYLHNEAKRMFTQDGTHGSILFCFSKEEGIVSVNQLPPNTEIDQIDEAIVNAVNEYNLFGIIVIGESWMYKFKNNDHTTFQLLDGEMKVSDLNKEDKQEALMVRMESRNGNPIIYLNEIIRSDNGQPVLKENVISNSIQKKWFKE